MELTKEKYFDICKENDLIGAKNHQEINKNNFYLPIEVAPCFILQIDALAFSWCGNKCYSYFQHNEEVITTVEELQNEIERCKELYEQKCRKAQEEMIVVKKNEIETCGKEYEIC